MTVPLLVWADVQLAQVPNHFVCSSKAIFGVAVVSRLKMFSGFAISSAVYIPHLELFCGETIGIVGQLGKDVVGP